jgi:rhodanese-related sulfurtransferase
LALPTRLRSIYIEMPVLAVGSIELKALGVQLDDDLFFICRSGSRSLAAAKVMAAAGYRACHNVAGGFEGPLDDERHHGSAGGWKAAGLPWQQGQSSSRTRPLLRNLSMGAHGTLPTSIDTSLLSQASEPAVRRKRVLRSTSVGGWNHHSNVLPDFDNVAYSTTSVVCST